MSADPQPVHDTGACPLCGAVLEAADTRCPACGYTLDGIGDRAPAFSRTALLLTIAGFVAVYVLTIAIVAATR